MWTRIALALSCAVGLFTLTACDASKSEIPSINSVESLTVGAADPLDRSSLIWLADHLGYFTKHGLKIDVKYYESGLAATKDLMAGKVDIATGAEFATAHCALEQTRLRIITTLSQSYDIKLVGRKDHGITRPSDIRHKRIGVLRGSGTEFFLDILMVLENIPFQDVEKVDLSPSDQVKAISKGEVDAVVVTEPFVNQISSGLGMNASSWSAQSGQSNYWLLLSTEVTTRNRAHAIHALVSSLVSAEGFLETHREESKRIVAQKLGPRHISALWDEAKFAVGLDRSLPLRIEAEQRWAGPDLEATQSRIPDLLNAFYYDALSSIKPESVTILH